MAIGDALFRAVTSLVAERAADSAVDAAEDYASSFGARHPRALRVVRIVGGGFLALGGLLEVVWPIVVAVHVSITEGIQLALLVLLLPLGIGIALVVWGTGLFLRGVRSGPSLIESQASQADAIALRERYERES